MKKLFLLFITACLGITASAQKVYFLYLQTDDQAPFYVRMGDKVYSSASSGFLIIPNLTDSVYNLNIGFAKSTQAETKFAVSINQNDRGFIIKNFDDGLALFDFRDMSLVKANAVQKDNTVYETKSDNFSSILSKAADDPSLLKVPVVKKDEVAKVNSEQKETASKPEASKPIEKAATENTGTAQLESTEIKKPANKEESANVDTVAKQPIAKETFDVQPSIKKDEPAVQAIAYKPSIITRRSESSTTEGFGLMYLDKQEEYTDTIRILIPASKIKLTSGGENSFSNEGTSIKFEKIDSLAEVKKKVTDTNVKDLSIKSSEHISSCKNIATEKDFMKLRKKMAAKENDEAMIEEARNEFRKRCFTVEQIRYLSTLFLTSAAKYQFFDAAYEHVMDKTSFTSLQSEIKDSYFLKRFKALIGE